MNTRHDQATLTPRVKNRGVYPNTKSQAFRTCLTLLTTVGLAMAGCCSAFAEAIDLSKHLSVDGKRLQLADQAVDDATLSQLEKVSFGHVQVINLARTKITDAGLSKLNPKRLIVLNLAGTAVTDQGLAKLRNFDALAAIDLSDTRISDLGLQYLSRLPIKQLGLKNTKVSDAGINSLSIMPLKKLSISGTKISSQGVIRLKSMHSGVELK
jgi:hypothetical protein